MSASLANSRKNFDAIVIGGGIAGASVGAFLAEDGLNIALLEKEDSLAYHTTGRSAALLTPYYGPESMRAFGAIGKPFLESPAFDTDLQVLSHRLTLTLVEKADAIRVERPPKSIWLDEQDCLEQVPFLKPARYIGGVVDTQVASIDVHALHTIYVKALTSRGGQVFRDSPVTDLKVSPSGVWEVITNSASYHSPTVINAAGAWGDHLAQAAGIGPVGLVPKRRTVIVVDSDQFDNVSFDDLPFVIVEPDYLYFQPFGIGQLMISPIDQTPSLPCDAQPDELDKAVTVARFEEVSTLNVKRIDHSWAGLRTFSPDGDPVIGWEPHQPGFFWLVGQGGYGIFTSPAIGRYAASLISGTDLPSTYRDAGFPFSKLAPDRFRLN